MSSSFPCNIPYMLSLIGKNILTKTDLSEIDIDGLIKEGKPIPLPDYLILDVGCGGGKWGFLVRDTFDLMLGQNFCKSEWQIHIDGIEPFPKCTTKVQTELYDNIIQKNVFDALGDLGQYDLIILGDVIEHFEKEKGHQLLNELFKHSDNILVSTPFGLLPQGPWAGNDLEVHKSGWKLEDFGPYSIVEHKIIEDETFKGLFEAVKHNPDNLGDINFSLIVLWLRKK